MFTNLTYNTFVVSEFVKKQVRDFKSLRKFKERERVLMNEFSLQLFLLEKREDLTDEEKEIRERAMKDRYLKERLYRRDGI